MKEDYLMGLEDMVPELSAQIVSDHNKLTEALVDIERFRKELEKDKGLIKAHVKDEIGKIRQEVQSCLSEHLGFIQEIHTVVEQDQRTKQQ